MTLLGSLLMAAQPGPEEEGCAEPHPGTVHLIRLGSGLGWVGTWGAGPVIWSPELCGQNKQGSSVKGWGICAHCHGNHTECVGGGERGAQLPFTDVRPPQPQTWGQLWVAWRPLEANEGWLDWHPFHLVSPWAGEGGKTLAQDLGWAQRALLAPEGRGALSGRMCQKYQAEIRATTLLPTLLKIDSHWEAESGEGDSPLMVWPAALV